MSYKDAIKELLDKKETSAGSFSTSGALTPIFPAIRIKDVGTLALPLQEFQAQSIRDKCSLAPFGRQEQTIYDKSVRNTWQLEPGQISIKNPDWNKVFMSRLVRKLGEELGLAGLLVKYELYKLLLYDEGSFFKQHRDSEKVPGMFATLVICLPSTFEGGELEVQHQKEKKIYDFGKLSETNIQYAAFYADCLHEVHLLKSGFRICLIYNLFYGKQNSEIPTALACSAAKNKALKLLESAEKQTDRILILLDYKYTNAELAFKKLKNDDRATLNYLSRLCKQMEKPMYLYLGTYERMEYGQGSWDDDFDVIETEYQLLNLIDENGKPFYASKIKIESEDEIIGDIDPGEFDDEHIENTGNAVRMVDRWYRRTVLMMIPRSKIWYERGRTDFNGMIRELVLHLKNDEHNKNETVKEKCNLILDCAMVQCFDNYNVLERTTKVLEALMILNDKQKIETHFKNTLIKCHNHLDTTSKNDKLQSQIKITHEFLGWHTFLNAIKFVTESKEIKSAIWFVNLLEYLMKEFKYPEIITSFKSFVKNTVLDESQFSNNITMIKELSHRYIQTAGDSETINNQNVIGDDLGEFLRQMVTFLTQMFCRLLQKVDHEAGSFTHSKPNNSVNDISDLYQLAYYTKNLDCLKMITRSALAILADEKINYLGIMVHEIKSICNLLGKPAAQSLPNFNEFVTVVYENIRTRLEKANSLANIPWKTTVRLQSSCACGDCKSVDAFLSNLQRKVRRFAIGQRRRNHIENLLRLNQLDLIYQTDTRSIPYILVVTKTYSSLSRKITTYSSYLKDIMPLIQTVPQSVEKESNIQPNRPPLTILTNQSPSEPKRLKQDTTIIFDC